MLKVLTIGVIMGVVQQAESSLEKVFNDLPQLPASSKEALAKVWPWLALIGGVIQLFAALALWRLVDWAERVTDAANSLSIYYTGYSAGPTGFEKMVIYIGVVVLLVDAVLLLMAFPKLQKRLKSGWDLLFLASLLNLVYAVLQIFTFQRGFGSFLGGLVGSAIGFYLLFQVKEKFTAK